MSARACGMHSLWLSVRGCSCVVCSCFRPISPTAPTPAATHRFATMISKRFESTAMVDRLQHVGKLLDDTDAKAIRMRLDAWLDENRDVHKKLLSFLESGMVHDMLAGSTGKRLPRSCVRMKLVSAQLTLQCLQRQNPTVNSSSLKNAKGKDKKSAEKLMYFAGGLPGCTPMRDGLAVADFLALFNERCAVYGNRLSRVSIDGSGLIDWSSQGVYGFAREGGTDVGAMALVARPEIKTATHIVHKFSGDRVVLSELGVGKIARELVRTAGAVEQRKAHARQLVRRLQRWRVFQVQRQAQSQVPRERFRQEDRGEGEGGLAAEHRGGEGGSRRRPDRIEEGGLVGHVDTDSLEEAPAHCDLSRYLGHSASRCR